MHRQLTVTPFEFGKVPDDVLRDLATWASVGDRLSTLGQPPPEAWLRQWTSQPDHHLLYAHGKTAQRAPCILGLMLCHAHEEDFVADNVVLSPQALEEDAPYELMRALARIALAFGCGAVVLRLCFPNSGGAIGRFYRSLGGVVGTLPTGEEEFAFASQTMECLLDEALRHRHEFLPSRISHQGKHPWDHQNA